MKTNLAYKTVNTGGLIETQGFSIKSGGKAFGVIIDGLYSNKAESITREIWSNAYDEMQQTGQGDVPIEVNFPNAFDSSFRTRDYGRGMSHEFMMDKENGYTVAFHSTKEDTNEAVGFLGIGRLSPFSYTDTYSVTCWDGKEVRYYSVYKKPNGEPDLALVGREPSTEPSGTEVAFAVSKEDRDKFKKAAMRVSLGFDVKPVCTNSEFNEWPTMDIEIQGDGYIIRQGLSDSYLGNRASYAKMGCVLYPLPTDMYPYGTLERNLFEKGLILEFEIGELQPTASRESLSFGPDEPTQKSINKKMDQVTDRIKNHIQDDINKAKNIFEAKMLVGSYLSFLSHLVINDILKGVTYDGVPVTDTTIRIPDIMHLTTLSSYNFHGKTVQSDRTDKLNVYSRHKYHIVIENITTGSRDVRGPTRILNWYRSTNSLTRAERILWFKTNEKNRQKTLKWIVKTFGNSVPVTYVKDMPDYPPASQNSNGTRAKTKVKRFTSGSWEWKDYNLSDQEFKDGGVYLKICNNSTLSGESQYAGLMALLIQAKVMANDKPLIVVPKTLWKGFEDSDKWVLLYDLGRDFVDKHGGYNAMRKVANREGRRNGDRVYDLTGLTVDIPLLTRYNNYVKSAEYRDPITHLTPAEVSALLDCLYRGKISWQTVRDIQSRQQKITRKLYQRMVKEYPLMRVWPSDAMTDVQEVKQELINYLNMKG